MSDFDESERTEEATPQRREDFRKKGQVAQSREVSVVLSLLASLLIMWALGRYFLDQLSQIFTRTFTDYLVASARREDWFPAIQFVFGKAALITAPLMAMLWVVNIASTLVQTGFLNNEEALSFDFNKINPVEGFKKIATLRSLVEGVKAILKVAVVSVVIYFVFRAEVKHIPHLVEYDVQTLFAYIGQVLIKLFGLVITFMMALALSDYLFQRWELEKKMRMTKQEMKEEIKSREGDPLVRARIRKLQRELATRRMMEDVKKAEVIITNPTHIAVALTYSKLMVAPKLVAKGANEVAERIKAIAKENKIPIVENKPLARTIFKTMKLGQQIPRELYTAIAEVLSYIFKLKRKTVS